MIPYDDRMRTNGWRGLIFRYAMAGLLSACGTATPKTDAGPGDAGTMDAGPQDAGPGCTGDSDCPRVRYCRLGYCISDENVPTGGPCTDDRDCLPSNLCDPATAQCVTWDVSGSVGAGDPCVDNEACATGLACRAAGTCATDPYSAGSEARGAQCYQDVDCTSGNCNIVIQKCD